MNPFTLYVSEKDSRDIYPGNDPSDFTIQLPKILILEGAWTCCIKKVHLNVSGAIQKPLMVLCYFGEESYRYGSNEPMLMEFVLKSEGGWTEYEEYCSDGYVGIKNNSLRIIRFRLTGDTDGVVSELRLQLHFKRRL